MIFVIALIFWYSDFGYSLFSSGNSRVVELRIAIGPDTGLGWRLVDLQELLELRVLFSFFPLSLEIILLPLRSVLVAYWGALLEFLLSSGLW